MHHHSCDGCGRKPHGSLANSDYCERAPAGAVEQGTVRLACRLYFRRELTLLCRCSYQNEERFPDAHQCATTVNAGASPITRPRAGLRRRDRYRGCAPHCCRVRSFMLVHAAYCVDITLDRNFQNPFSATRNDTIEIMAIDCIELKRLQRDSNSSHLFRGERDQIRIAAHEAEEFSVCRHRRDVG